MPRGAASSTWFFLTCSLANAALSPYRLRECVAVSSVETGAWKTGDGRRHWIRDLSDCLRRFQR